MWIYPLAIIIAFMFYYLLLWPSGILAWLVNISAMPGLFLFSLANTESTPKDIFLRTFGGIIGVIIQTYLGVVPFTLLIYLCQSIQNKYGFAISIFFWVASLASSVNFGFNLRAQAKEAQGKAEEAMLKIWETRIKNNVDAESILSDDNRSYWENVKAANYYVMTNSLTMVVFPIYFLILTMMPIVRIAFYEYLPWIS